MISNEILSFIALGGVVFGTLGVMTGVFPYLKKKGINVQNGLDDVQKVVDTSHEILSVVKNELPQNSIINVLDIIDKAARIGVGNAEQLYHAGNIEKDGRIQAAQNVVYSILNELNIAVDDNKKSLIDAAIQNAVNDLGHSSLDAGEKKTA